MEQTTISADKRTKTGKGSARATRREGKIPAVIYSHFNEPLALAVDPKELRQTVIGSHHGFNTVLTLNLGDGSTRTALLKDWQVDPVSRQLLHADFVEIRMDERLPASIPLKLIGRPQGVIDGGFLNQIRREITVRCLPGNIPVEIEIDVSKLRINDSLHISDITPPEGVEIPYNNDYTVLVVTPPEAEETPVTEETEEAGAIPAPVAPTTPESE